MLEMQALKSKFAIYINEKWCLNLSSFDYINISSGNFVYYPASSFIHTVQDSIGVKHFHHLEKRNEYFQLSFDVVYNLLYIDSCKCRCNTFWKTCTHLQAQSLPKRQTFYYYFIFNIIIIVARSMSYDRIFARISLLKSYIYSVCLLCIYSLANSPIHS